MATVFKSHQHLIVGYTWDCAFVSTQDHRNKHSNFLVYCPLSDLASDSLLTMNVTIKLEVQRWQGPWCSLRFILQWAVKEPELEYVFWLRLHNCLRQSGLQSSTHSPRTTVCTWVSYLFVLLDLPGLLGGFFFLYGPSSELSYEPIYLTTHSP